jgi:RNA recognition motif-containing protein
VSDVAHGPLVATSNLLIFWFCLCFSFVRFREIESVYKAVKTLHKWPLKGSKLVVDIAKDTGDRIKKGNQSSFINTEQLNKQEMIIFFLVMLVTCNSLMTTTIIYELCN